MFIIGVHPVHKPCWKNESWRKLFLAASVFSLHIRTYIYDRPIQITKLYTTKYVQVLNATRKINCQSNTYSLHSIHFYFTCTSKSFVVFRSALYQKLENDSHWILLQWYGGQRTWSLIKGFLVHHIHGLNNYIKQWRTWAEKNT